MGGLLNATLGNLTEMVIALAALRAGMHALVKSSIAGAIVTNGLFMLGASFLLGGLKHHVQEYNKAAPASRRGCCSWQPSPCWFPRFLGRTPPRPAFAKQLSLGLSVLLIVAYGARPAVHAQDAPGDLPELPLGKGGGGALAPRLALATLAGVTVLWRW